MTEINTFSSAVDDIVARSGRPDRQADIISYLRTTIRECQTKDFFDIDLVEDQITGVASDPYIWSRPNYFRQMAAVQYPSVIDQQGNVAYADFAAPGKKQLRLEEYYYLSGTSFIFAGNGAASMTSGSVNINVAYYAFLPPLAYYDVDARPATFSLETETWTYLTAITDEDQEAARALVTNWLLTDWYDMCCEGALAKVYKTNDDVRAVTTFAQYKQLQTTMLEGVSRAARGGNR
jgi:hypothetical protein